MDEPASNEHVDAPSFSRRLVQIYMVALGAFIAAGGVVSAVAARSLGATGAEETRRLHLYVAARLITAVGLGGVFIFQALAFRNWQTFFSPFRPEPGVTRAQRARSYRQISGKESYSPEEIPRLRRLAQQQVARENTPATISVIVFLIGFALAPPVLSGDVLSDPTGLDRALQVFAVVFLGVLVASLVTSRVRGLSPRQFLDRTSARRAGR